MAELIGDLMAALFTVRWMPTCVSVAMVNQPYHAGPVPRSRKAAVAVAVD